MSLKQLLKDLQIPPRDRMFAVRIPAKDMELIRRLAKYHGVSQSDFVIALTRLEADSVARLELAKKSGLKPRPSVLSLIETDPYNAAVVWERERNKLHAENARLTTWLHTIKELTERYCEEVAQP
jgi:hypothetical protein